MICSYLDDTGNTGADLTNREQPIHYNGAILVPDTKWAHVSTQIKDLEQYARRKGYTDAQIEFHGSQLYHGERGGRGWGAVSRSDRHDIYTKALGIITEQRLHIVLGCCDKRRMLRYTAPEHPHAVAMWLCLERIARYARSNGDLAFVVADDCSSSVREIARKVLTDYRTRGAPFGRSVDLGCLIDTIHFMSSAQSQHIQLCDLALYAIRRFETTSDATIRPLAETALTRVWERQTIPY